MLGTNQMSVRTEADEKREQAIDSVQTAIECLSRIVVNRCEGADDFNAAYKLGHKQALKALIEVRDDLS